MKKTIFISALVLAVVTSAVVFSQSSPETMSRIRDSTTPGSVSNVTRLGATQNATNYGLNTASGCYYYPGAGADWYRWTGTTAGADNVLNTTPAPYTYTFNMVYNTSTGRWDRQAGSAGSNTYGYDATGLTWIVINAIEAQADGQASTLNGLVTSSLGYGFNGTTWDMLRVGPSNELQITDVATRAGEDVANDYRKVKIESRYTYTPSYTDTDMAAGVETTIYGPVEVLADQNFCIYIKNIDDDGGQAFTDVDVYISPNNSDWVDMAWNDCDTLAFGIICNYCVSGNAYRYIKVTATSGSDNYARAWYTSNR